MSLRMVPWSREATSADRDMPRCLAILSRLSTNLSGSEIVIVAIFLAYQLLITNVKGKI